jgi:hypothetical protein
LRDVQDQFITGQPFQNRLQLFDKVSVTSTAMFADVYMVESSAYMDTHIWFHSNNRSMVKREKIRGPRELPCGKAHFTCSTLEMLSLKKTL